MNHRRVTRTTYVAAVVAFVAWLPFLRTPLESDEAGFLMVARQWESGSSLYGDYWVDRPPLLIWLFRLAAQLGTGSLETDGIVVPGVRLMGATASAVAVLLAGVLAARLSTDESRWPRRIVPLLATALLSSPLLGMPAANGEVLSLPFTLAGVLCVVLCSAGPPGRRTLALAAAAGAAGMAAMLVKQNMADVFVFAIVLLPLAARRPIDLLGRMIAGAAGAVVVLAAAVGSAATRGTTPAALWDAVVVFRLQAGAVIGESSSPATTSRFILVLLCFIASGAAITLITTGFLATRTALRHGPRGAPLPAAALAMAGWEVLGVAAGGSYWLHYLTGLVPGVVLLACLVRPIGRRRWVVTGCLITTALACLVAWVVTIGSPVSASLATDAEVAHWIRTHADPDDRVVVAYGRPDIVAASGLTSPYEHLWSLPVRVRDPHLTELVRVLDGPESPRWVVVFGKGMDSWAIDADRAQAYLDEHYVQRTRIDDLRVWERVR